MIASGTLTQWECPHRGLLYGPPMGYVRVGRRHWSPEAVRYHASQRQLNAAILAEMDATTLPLSDGRYRLGTAIYLDPAEVDRRVTCAKCKARKPPRPATVCECGAEIRRLPDSGDWSNWHKAVEDALCPGPAAQRKGMVPVLRGDTGRWVAGPACLADGRESGVYLAEDGVPRMEWAIWRARE